MLAERPYEPLGMTTERWRRVRPRPVRITDLHPSQDGLRWEGLFAGESWSGDRFPHVVRFEGRLHVVDGHHRIARKVLRGRRWMLVRVLDTPE